jgi:hypothetical protein
MVQQAFDDLTNVWDEMFPIEPATIPLSKLRKGFPEDWTEQREMFGIE